MRPARARDPIGPRLHASRDGISSETRAGQLTRRFGDAVTKRLTSDGAKLDECSKTALAFLTRKLTPTPPRNRPEGDRFGVLTLREYHADHWHLSYGAELDAADVALKWVAEHRDLVWGEIRW